MVRRRDPGVPALTGLRRRFRATEFTAALKRAGLTHVTLAATIGASPQALRLWATDPRAQPSATLLVAAVVEINRRLRDLGRTSQIGELRLADLWDPAP